MANASRGLFERQNELKRVAKPLLSPARRPPRPNLCLQQSGMGQHDKTHPPQAVHCRRQPCFTSGTQEGKQAAGARAHIHDLRRRFGGHDHLLLVCKPGVRDEQHVAGAGGVGEGQRGSLWGHCSFFDGYSENGWQEFCVTGLVRPPGSSLAGDWLEEGPRAARSVALGGGVGMLVEHLAVVAHCL